MDDEKISGRLRSVRVALPLRRWRLESATTQPRMEIGRRAARRFARGGNIGRPFPRVATTAGLLPVRSNSLHRGDWRVRAKLPASTTLRLLRHIPAGLRADKSRSEEH